MSFNVTKTASMRSAYGEALVEIGKLNENVVVLDADLSKATKTSTFAEAFPERFYNVGIAEQNMISVAAGLASCGKIPFATTLAVFTTMRACEQVRTSVTLGKFNVKAVGFYGGLCTAENGPTHQCIADINMMRGLPNMTVLAPSDASSCKSCVRWAAEHKGPVYLRGLRDAEPVIYHSEQKIDVTKAQVLKEGRDVVIIANGFMVHKAIQAAEKLETSGVHAAVLDVVCIKPIDQDTIIHYANQCKAVLTVEEHNIYGGLGSSVAEVLCRSYPVPMRILGVPDRYSGSGKHEDLLEAAGLTTENIIKNVNLLLRNEG